LSTLEHSWNTHKSRGLDSAVSPRKHRREEEEEEEAAEEEEEEEGFICVIGNGGRGCCRSPRKHMRKASAMVPTALS
jgi:hypothetical protein